MTAPFTKPYSGEERRRLRRYRDASLAEQQGQCFYCKCPIDEGNVTGDHKRARSRHGPTLRHNIVAACSDCNRAKGNMHWLRFLKCIRNPRPSDSLDIWLAHFRRRLWKRTWAACKRIEREAA